MKRLPRLAFARCDLGAAGLAKRLRHVTFLWLLAVAGTAFAADGLQGRLVVGYQGWFGCPGDFQGNREWQHWFHGAPAADRLTVDQLPATDAFRREDLCDTGLKRSDGAPVYVFSSQNAKVVDQHLRWMKQHGIDALAFQRFVAHTRDPVLRRRSDNVLAHVRRSAQAQGRLFYITYDVSGSDAATVADAIRADWKYLAGELRMTASKAYLRQGGKPLLQLWGFGFRDRPGEPAEVLQLLAALKAGREGLPAATVVGGVPTGWRTLTGDSHAAAAWGRVYRSFDVLSPWAVGRYADEAGADRFRRETLAPDLAETRRLGIGYLPVVFPGFSWRNLMRVRGEPAPAILDQIPRRCGRFLQRQVDNALAAGATSLYAAMFDEVDEATALFPVDTRPEAAPAGAQLLAGDASGCVTPPDWYLRLTGEAAKRVRERR
jgi:hypothetical protein